MTRDEQKRIKEVKAQLNSAIRTLTKDCGFKKVNGYVYKFIDDFVYVAIISVPPIDLGKKIKVDIFFKPLVLDELFWEIFEIDEAKTQPKSFHVQGAFTARLVSLTSYKIPFEDDAEMNTVYTDALETIAVFISDHAIEIDNLSKFKKLIEHHEYHLLNLILVEIYEQNYELAFNMLEKAISEHKTGGFAVAGGKNIFEYALDYCKERMNE